MEEVAVSIHCMTYNHENYIADTIESFLMQKTTFPFEILIHDDASTDLTAEIIKKYETKYPDLIKPIYQKENQYSKHISIFKTYQLPRMKGKYYAICEGDDYWTDPLKLQKQFDEMEKHPEVDICSHKSIMVNAKDNTVVKECIPVSDYCIIPVEKVIEGGGGFVMTNSLFVRKGFKAENLPFRDKYIFDYSLQIAGALRGGMLFIPDCMSAYRVLSESSWVKKNSKEPLKRIQHSKYVNDMLKQLNIDTDYHYNKSIKKVINRNKVRTIVRTIKGIVNF